MEESNRMSKAAKKGSANTNEELTKEVQEVIRRELGDSKEKVKQKQDVEARELRLQVTKEVEEAFRKESATLSKEKEEIMTAKLQEKLAVQVEENADLKLAQERARAEALIAHMAEMEAIRKQALEQDKVEKVKAEAEREHWRQMVISKEAMEREKLEFTLKMHAEAKFTTQASLM